MYECMVAWGDEIDLLVVERLFIIEFPVVSNLPTSLHLVRTVAVVEIKAWAPKTRYTNSQKNRYTPLQNVWSSLVCMV